MCFPNAHIAKIVYDMHIVSVQDDILFHMQMHVHTFQRNPKKLVIGDDKCTSCYVLL